jgi:hypothetical protein
LRTIQNWQHWKDVRKRAYGARDTIAAGALATLAAIRK